MEHLRKLGLLDGDGQPFSAHIESVLSRLLPRLRREFPAIQDDVAQIEILEEAARRLVSRELRAGPIEKINGYAWVTIRSIAMARLRYGPGRVLQRTLANDASESVLARATAHDGSPEQMERIILLREVLAVLTPNEQRVCLWRYMGYSSEEIARQRGSTINAVNLVFFKAKEKIRRALGIQQSEPTPTAPAAEPNVRTAEPHPSASDQADAETEPTS